MLSFLWTTTHVGTICRWIDFTILSDDFYFVNILIPLLSLSILRLLIYHWVQRLPRLGAPYVGPSGGPKTSGLRKREAGPMVYRSK